MKKKTRQTKSARVDNQSDTTFGTLSMEDCEEAAIEMQQEEDALAAMTEEERAAFLKKEEQEFRRLLNRKERQAKKREEYITEQIRRAAQKGAKTDIRTYRGIAYFIARGASLLNFVYIHLSEKSPYIELLQKDEKAFRKFTGLTLAHLAGCQETGFWIGFAGLTDSKRKLEERCHRAIDELFVKEMPLPN